MCEPTDKPGPSVPTQSAEPSTLPPAFFPKRVELLTWFRQNAASLAPAYEGAFTLLENGAFPGRIHFLAHAIRDICNQLVFVLDPQLESASHIQYHDSLDEIEKLWGPIDVVEETSDAEEMSKVEIGLAVARKIDSLIKEHRSSRRRPSSAELLFNFLMRREPTHAGFDRRIADDFQSVAKWFMKWTHFRRSIGQNVDEAELRGKFNQFESMLHSFVGSFFTATEEIDEILRKANR